MSLLSSAVTHTVSSPVPIPAEIAISGGPLLLASLSEGPSLAAHRARWGALLPLGVDQLIDEASALELRGRGGAGFPFAIKLRTAAESSGRAEVVINLSEGEPVSAKDTALALTRPHLVLDGAVAAATADAPTPSGADSWLRLPAPPWAITGTDTSAATRATRSRS